MYNSKVRRCVDDGLNILGVKHQMEQACGGFVMVFTGSHDHSSGMGDDSNGEDSKCKSSCKAVKALLGNLTDN